MGLRRNGLRLATAVAVVAAATLGASSARADADGHVPSVRPAAMEIPPDVDIPVGLSPIDLVNWWRAFGGSHDGRPYPPLRHDPLLDAGPQNHVEYLADLAGDDVHYCGHGSADGHPRDPELNYSHRILFCGLGMEQAITGWIRTPYHGSPLLSVGVDAVGFGATASPDFAAADFSDEAETAAGLWLWPKDGGVLPTIMFFGSEIPDPREECPSTDRYERAGPTLRATLIGGSEEWPWSVVEQAEIVRTADGSVVPSCLLGGSDIFVAEPLRPATAYSVELTVARWEYDFSIGEDVVVERVSTDWTFATPCRPIDIGDCTADADADGELDAFDNCWLTPNIDQRDDDLNRIGDACEGHLDPDWDGVGDPYDNCADTFNPEQGDADGDGLGDACDRPDVPDVGTSPVCAGTTHPFTDVRATSFAQPHIACISQLGITTGTSPTTFSPADHVTREQMAAFIARLWRALGEACPTATVPFRDTSRSFAEADIRCIYGVGITTGTSPTTFSPTQPVTREQMAAFIARLWRALDGSCPEFFPPFVDTWQSFASADVACIYGLGITTGTSPTTFSPTQPVTREQMAAFIARVLVLATAPS